MATGDRAIFGGGRTDGRNAISRIFFSTRRVVGYFFPVCTICEKTRGARMIEPKLMVWLSHKRKEGSNKRAMMLLSSRAEKTDKNSIVHPSLPAVFPASETNAKTATITIIHAAASSSQALVLVYIFHALLPLPPLALPPPPPPPPIPQKNHHPFPSTFSLPLRPTYIFAFVPVSASFRLLQNLPDQCTCVRA